MSISFLDYFLPQADVSITGYLTTCNGHFISQSQTCAGWTSGLSGGAKPTGVMLCTYPELF